MNRLIALPLLLGALAAPASASDRNAIATDASVSIPTYAPVSLYAAKVIPTWIHSVAPGRGATVPAALRTCRGEEGVALVPTDLGVYRANGEAHGAQSLDEEKVLNYWELNGRRVSYDGERFRNHTRRTVLVAVWFDERPSDCL